MIAFAGGGVFTGMRTPVGGLLCPGVAPREYACGGQDNALKDVPVLIPGAGGYVGYMAKGN